MVAFSGYKARERKQKRWREHTEKNKHGEEKKQRVRRNEKTRKTRGSFHSTSSTSCLYYNHLRPEQEGTERKKNKPRTRGTRVADFHSLVSSLRNRGRLLAL
ncbi:hypothetical protein Peur_000621 [Populus x canadensis]